MIQHGNKILFILLITVALSACSTNDSPSLTKLNSRAIILAFGDSLTYGTGTNRESSYPAILEELTGREVINAGIPGEQTAEGLLRLSDTLDEYQPQLLILCLGGNDMLRQKTLAEIEQNLEKMVVISRERGIPVLLLGVPRPAIFGLRSDEVYYRLANSMKIPLEAEIIPEVLSERELKSDQIHPNTEGYRMIAEAVFKQLKESGAL